MKPYTDKQLERIRHDVQEFISRQSLRGDGVTLAEQCRLLLHEWQPGVTAANTDGGRGAGGPSDPTGRAAIERVTDPMVMLQRQWHTAWQRLIDAANDIDRITATLTTRAEPETVDGRWRKAPLGAGECQACGEYASGTPSDRLRGGLCDRDRKAWERAGRPDRVAWVRAQKGQYDEAP